ncbi:MAG: hypothetical protein Q8N63_04495 [Nanoarchaeota archaeon]|nr:hypothetical protein [Nanoarchaeota archaeon]
MNDMSNLLIVPEKFLYDVPNKLDGIEWYAASSKGLNRNGIPESNGAGFKGIFDMDFICKNYLHGEELKRFRKPRETIAVPWEQAMTLYRIGEDAFVVNMSSGSYQDRETDRRTIVLTKPSENPNPEIQDRFREYYGKEPKHVQAVINIEISLGW